MSANELTVDGHTCLVALTTRVSVHTGRPLYRVECVTCHELVHAATTGPEQQAAFHAREMRRAAVEALAGELTDDELEGIRTQLRAAIAEAKDLVCDCDRARRLNDRSARRRIAEAILAGSVSRRG